MNLNWKWIVVEILKIVISVLSAGGGAYAAMSL